MDDTVNNMIESINFSMFKESTTDLDPKLLKETLFFREEFRKRYADLDFIHSHINKIAERWDIVLTQEFKNKVLNFNNKVYEYRVKQADIQRKMIQMATDHEAGQLFRSINDIGLNPENDIINSFRKAKISKRKGPSRKRLN